MKKRRRRSRIEVWSREYINEPNKRQFLDRNAVIVQIRPAGTPDDYIVEVVDRA